MDILVLTVFYTARCTHVGKTKGKTSHHLLYAFRLIQRMGRTGRKRSGRIVVLVTEGKEERVSILPTHHMYTIDACICVCSSSLFAMFGGWYSGLICRSMEAAELCLPDADKLE